MTPTQGCSVCRWTGATCVQRLDSWGYRREPIASARPTQENCSCGGSASFSLVLGLKRGDRVSLVMTAGRLAVTESSELLSTFSAVFLYSAPKST
ncbi:hypothetical protein AAFF_G00181930 [Aldrovandia affinis]|uniref:C1q domain-containing protein n=1 Tax=Aldrovandia affinis TaxID=143900 RepID=A0AAD7RL02_9TELE|nr:hypothetical protein AAFF_G00181930 [Aldrovandia affinis]